MPILDPEGNVDPDNTQTPGSGGEGDSGGDGSSSGGTSSGSSGSTTTSGGSGGGGDGKKDGGGSLVSGDAGLPGVRGKDYRVVRYGDRVYIVYWVTLPNGRKINTTYRVPQHKLDEYGIGKGDGTHLNKSQFKNLNVFGDIQDVVRGNPGRHPFRKWLERAEERYGGTSLFRNREAMSVLLMGWTEKWGTEDLQAALQNTKWGKNHTRWQEVWELDYDGKERKRLLDEAKEDIKTGLSELYGDGWRKHVDGDKLGDWARKIASGKLGDPDSALRTFLSKHRRRAERIEGTPSWLSEVEERERLDRWEDIYEDYRQQARQWLGPSGAPSNDAVRRMAKKRASAKITDADFIQWLRQKKQHLYPYLDEDEPWQERAETYRQIAERLTGTTLSLDDKLFRDFQSYNNKGEPIEGLAMSFSDFEKHVAKARPRLFWGGPVAKEEGFNILQTLLAAFEGVGA